MTLKVYIYNIKRSGATDEGIPRIIEAIKSNMWPNLKRKIPSSKDDKASEKKILILVIQLLNLV